MSSNNPNNYNTDEEDNDEGESEQWTELKRFRNRLNSQRTRVRERVQLETLESARCRLVLSNTALQYHNQHLREAMQKIREYLKQKKAVENSTNAFASSQPALQLPPSSFSTDTAPLNSQLQALLKQHETQSQHRQRSQSQPQLDTSLLQALFEQRPAPRQPHQHQQQQSQQQQLSQQQYPQRHHHQQMHHLNHATAIAAAASMLQQTPQSRSTAGVSGLSSLSASIAGSNRGSGGMATSQGHVTNNPMDSFTAALVSLLFGNNQNQPQQPQQQLHITSATNLGVGLQQQSTYLTPGVILGAAGATSGVSGGTGAITPSPTQSIAASPAGSNQYETLIHELLKSISSNPPPSSAGSISELATQQLVSQLPNRSLINQHTASAEKGTSNGTNTIQDRDRSQASTSTTVGTSETSGSSTHQAEQYTFNIEPPSAGKKRRRAHDKS